MFIADTVSTFLLKILTNNNMCLVEVMFRSLRRPKLTLCLLFIMSSVSGGSRGGSGGPLEPPPPPPVIICPMEMN